MNDLPPSEEDIPTEFSQSSNQGVYQPPEAREPERNERGFVMKEMGDRYQRLERNLDDQTVEVEGETMTVKPKGWQVEHANKTLIEQNPDANLWTDEDFAQRPNIDRARYFTDEERQDRELKARPLTQNEILEFEQNHLVEEYEKEFRAEQERYEAAQRGKGRRMDDLNKRMEEGLLTDLQYAAELAQIDPPMPVHNPPAPPAPYSPQPNVSLHQQRTTLQPTAAALQKQEAERKLAQEQEERERAEVRKASEERKRNRWTVKKTPAAEGGSEVVQRAQSYAPPKESSGSMLEDERMAAFNAPKTGYGMSSPVSEPPSLQPSAISSQPSGLDDSWMSEEMRDALNAPKSGYGMSGGVSEPPSLQPSAIPSQPSGLDDSWMPQEMRDALNAPKSGYGMSGGVSEPPSPSVPVVERKAEREEEPVLDLNAGQNQVIIKDGVEMEKVKQDRNLEPGKLHPFAMDGQGRVYAEDHKDVKKNIPPQEGVESTPPPENSQKAAVDPTVYVHHSAFLRGEKAAGAGELRLDGIGQLKEFTDRSGHYQPGDDQNIQTLERLEEMGVDLNQVRMTRDRSDPDTTNNRMTGMAQEYLQGEPHLKPQPDAIPMPDEDSQVHIVERPVNKHRSQEDNTPWRGAGEQPERMSNKVKATYGEEALQNGEIENDELAQKSAQFGARLGRVLGPESPSRDEVNPSQVQNLYPDNKPEGYGPGADDNLDRGEQAGEKRKSSVREMLEQAKTGRAQSPNAMDQFVARRNVQGELRQVAAVENSPDRIDGRGAVKPSDVRARVKEMRQAKANDSNSQGEDNGQKKVKVNKL